MAGHSSLPGADYVNLSALPAIHVLDTGKKGVDTRVTCAKTRFALLPGHDEEKV
jgi:hypothetical protein